MDAVAIVVHRDNPLQALTMDDVGKIFSGEFTNWSQVGGPSAPIKVFALRENFGARGVVQDIFMKGEPYTTTIRDVDVHSMMSDFVSADPYAIGFCSVAFAQQCKVLPIKADADAEAVFPTSESIRDHTYPASRDLYFYQLSESKNVYARDFIRVAQSVKGQEFVEYCGFVDMKNSSPLEMKDATVDSAAVASLQKAENNTTSNAIAEDTDKKNVEAKIPDASSEKKNAEAPSEAAGWISTATLPPLEQLDGEVVSAATRQKVLKPYREALSGASQLPMILYFELESTTLDQPSQKVLDDLIKQT